MMLLDRTAVAQHISESAEQLLPESLEFAAAQLDAGFACKSLEPLRAAMAKMTKTKIHIRESCSISIRGSVVRVPACIVQMEGSKLTVRVDGKVSLEVLPCGTTLSSNTSEAIAAEGFFRLLQSGAIPVEKIPAPAGSCVWCNRGLSSPSSKAKGAGDSCLKQHGRVLRELLQTAEVADEGRAHCWNAETEVSAVTDKMWDSELFISNICLRMLIAATELDM